MSFLAEKEGFEPYKFKAHQLYWLFYDTFTTKAVTSSSTAMPSSLTYNFILHGVINPIAPKYNVWLGSRNKNTPPMTRAVALAIGGGFVFVKFA